MKRKIIPWLMLAASTVLFAGSAQAEKVSVKYAGPSGQGDLIYWVQSIATTNLVLGTNGTVTLPSGVTMDILAIGELTNSTDIILCQDLTPETDNAFDLGTASTEYKNGYFDGILVLDQFSNTVAIIMSQSLQPETDDAFSIGDATHELDNLYVDGEFHVDLITNSAAILIGQSVSPNVTQVFDLGSAAAEWRNLFLSGLIDASELTNATALVVCQSVEPETTDVFNLGSTAKKFASVSAVTYSGTTAVVSGDITANGNINGDGATDITGIETATADNIVVTNSLTAGTITGATVVATSTLSTPSIAISGGGTSVTFSATALESTGTFATPSAAISGGFTSATAVVSGDITASGNIVGDGATDMTGMETITMDNGVVSNLLSLGSQALPPVCAPTGSTKCWWKQAVSITLTNSTGTLTWATAFDTGSTPWIYFQAGQELGNTSYPYVVSSLSNVCDFAVPAGAGDITVIGEGPMP